MSDNGIIKGFGGSAVELADNIGGALFDIADAAIDAWINAEFELDRS